MPAAVATDAPSLTPGRMWIDPSAQRGSRGAWLTRPSPALPGAGTGVRVDAGASAGTAGGVPLRGPSCAPPSPVGAAASAAHCVSSEGGMRARVAHGRGGGPGAGNGLSRGAARPQPAGHPPADPLAAMRSSEMAAVSGRRWWWRGAKAGGLAEAFARAVLSFNAVRASVPARWSAGPGGGDGR